ncbi:MAG: glycoside hydrolase family 127 protein [Oscillospiraceae bacterium]|jgi:DUF1680 family protein|nr:glycoside hydrolase family 127 protein [Oscillospiraceae bacterium]
MEYSADGVSLKIKNAVKPLTGGVRLTGGRLKEAFDNNLAFLKRFDVDRMLYWFRVHAGEPAPGAPYAFGGGHFENNLHGQTAGQFLMGAGTALLWTSDDALRRKTDEVIAGILRFRREDGCLIPAATGELFEKEYPNYVRAWLTFGLLAAGYAGNEQAFSLVRGFGDWFNKCGCLPYVKDLNLGFQGILANTELYRSPVGVPADMETAQKYYREDWWLDWLDKEEQRAIYRHPGNHPHGTLLTALEAYLDLYRATGEEYLLSCVQKALRMFEDKWQHVGGGIVMCESFQGEIHYPGCNLLESWLPYNELCCSTFWILLNQRLHLLFPDNAHYTDEVEKSVYNMLIACQEGDQGYHYLARLEGSKDSRYTDIASCCAGTGARLVSMLPQLLYTYTDDLVYVDLYSDSRAEINGSEITVKTDMPYGGRVEISLEKWAHKALKLRIPVWCAGAVTVNGQTAKPGEYLALEGLSSGESIQFELPFKVKTTLYAGREEIPGKRRYAMEYGPLLLAALRRDNVILRYSPDSPIITEIGKGRFTLQGNHQIELRAYMDISDEPLTVYPVVE